MSLQKIITYLTSKRGFVNLFFGLKRRYNDYFNRLTYVLKNRKIKNSFIYLNIKEELETIIKIHENNNYIAQNYSDELVKEAEYYINGNINLLGVDIKYDKKINWHLDYKTGYEWKKGRFFQFYDQEAIGTKCDVKIPREISRSHHLLKVATAYYFNKNEKYAEFCVEQILDWIDENPCMYSINWGCTMDVAIRAINWIWALRLIIDSKVIDDNTKYKIYNSLYEHGWYIYRYPEKEKYNNGNHYLADLAGQVYLGVLFESLYEPKKWLEKAIIELFKEIRYQILPSGMSYERCTNYNRLVLELILTPVLLLKNNGYEIPQDIWYRIETMFEFIMNSIKPDGRTPIIGDQDNGRLLPFGNEDVIDYRYLLSLGAVLFNRADFKKYGNGYNIYCYFLGSENSKMIYDRLENEKSEIKSKGFKDAGLYILRKENAYMAFNMMGKGLYPEIPTGTHTHSDIFSFELFTNGKTFIVDPGSYVYTSDIKERNLFRSTKMHNTIVVDGFSQNNIKDETLWDFERNAIPELIEWKSNDDYDSVSASHNGYERLKKPVTHKRSVLFDKKIIQWKITDEITGAGEHLIEWYLHFDSGIDFEITGNKVKTQCNDGNNLLIHIDFNDTIKIEKIDSFVSKSYGTREKSRTLKLQKQSTVPLLINFIINRE